MRRLGIAVVVGALLGGTTAYAQETEPPAFGIGPVTAAAGTNVSYLTFPTTSTAFFPVLVTDPRPAGADTRTYSPGITSFDSFVTNDTAAGLITFESSNAQASVGYMLTESYSVVQFDFANNTGGNVEMHSTITPAGMGFYLANVGSDGSCLANNCAQVSPDSPFGFNDLRAAQNLFFDGAVLGGVGFNFDILIGEVGGTIDGATSIFNRNGDITLRDFGENEIFVDPFNLNNLSTQLAGFGRDTALSFDEPLNEQWSAMDIDNPLHSLGYSWGETAINGVMLGTGAHTLYYVTNVYSYTNATACLNGGTACLLGYAGFGDPIGAGDISAFALSTFDVGPLNHSTGLIQGLNFSSVTFNTPTFTPEGGFSFELVSVNPNAPVPEPATWAMLIMGFGFLGSVLRRRRAFAHA